MREMKRTLKQWLETPAYPLNCLELRTTATGSWRAKVDGRGWFAPQWQDVPADVQITANDIAVYVWTPSR